MPRYLEILAAFDNTWCARYGNNADNAARAIQALVYQANQPFVRQTCVRLNLISIDAHCNDSGDPYRRPAPNSKGIVDSLMIRSMFQSYWVATLARFLVRRDVAMLFTGYKDDTISSGSSTPGSSCSRLSGYAWVELSDPLVVAREVGHTLNATDSSYGIMHGAFNRLNNFEFSDSSLSQIRGFMVSCRSRCFTNNSIPFAGIPLQWSNTMRISEWFGNFHSGFGLTGQFNSGAGIAFGDVSGTGKSDIFVMFIDNLHRENRVFYYVGKNVRRMTDGSYNIERWTGPQRVPRWFGHDSSGGDIAFSNIRGSTSKDILIFHIDNARGQNRGYYRIGFAMDANGVVRGRWSGVMRIPGHLGDSNHGGGIALGGIRSPSSKDLVVMHITDNAGENHGYYRVGFDLGPDGRVRGGWSSLMRVPGWFGHKNEGGSVDVYDTNGNGMLDIVIFHIDNPRGENRGYYRIGRDLDTEGRVTKGWSSVQRVPNWVGHQNGGGGIALQDLGDGLPTTAVFHIDNQPGENHGYVQFGYGSLSI